MSKVAISVMTAMLGASMCAGAARAAEYKISVIGDASNFVGCLASNDAAGVGFLAVGATVAMFGNSDSFKIAKGDEVKGTWSVDGAAPTSFSSKADSAHTATIDVPNTAEAVTALTTGKQIAIVANGVTATLPLDGSEQAFTDLGACMAAKKAP